MEQSYEVRPVGIKYICDTCGEGEMLPTGTTNWSSDPPQFEHSCNECSYKVNYNEKYPIIKFVKE